MGSRELCICTADYIQQHQIVKSALKVFMLVTVHICAADARRILKLIGRSEDQLLFRETKLGSGSAGVPRILWEEKCVVHLQPQKLLKTLNTFCGGGVVHSYSEVRHERSVQSDGKLAGMCAEQENLIQVHNQWKLLHNWKNSVSTVRWTFLIPKTKWFAHWAWAEGNAKLVLAM